MVKYPVMEILECCWLLDICLDCFSLLCIECCLGSLHCCLLLCSCSSSFLLCRYRKSLVHPLNRNWPALLVMKMLWWTWLFQELVTFAPAWLSTMFWKLSCCGLKLRLTQFQNSGSLIYRFFLQFYGATKTL